jgi:hypothetical protein
LEEGGVGISCGDRGEAELGAEGHGVSQGGVFDERELVRADVSCCGIHTRKETRETTEAGSSAECGEFVEAGKPQLGVVVHTRTQSSLSAERDEGGYLDNILQVRRQRESKSGGREKGFEGD